MWTKKKEKKKNTLTLMFEFVYPNEYWTFYVYQCHAEQDETN